MSGDQETSVEVHIGRLSQTDEEITITVLIPADEQHAKRKLYVSMTPADFALALTGMGGLAGKMSVYEYPKRHKGGAA